MTYRQIKNAADRLVPYEINGKLVIPFTEESINHKVSWQIGKMELSGQGLVYSKNKVINSLQKAFEKLELKSGITIATHGQYRNGDLLTEAVFEAAKRMNLRNLVWAPVQTFSNHQTLLPYIQDGTIGRIQGNLSDPLARFFSKENFGKPMHYFSGYGRFESLKLKLWTIDLFIIGASYADENGNFSGYFLDKYPGVLNGIYPDVFFARHRLVVTEKLVSTLPQTFHTGDQIDAVVEWKQLTNPDKIMPQTIKLSSSPGIHLLSHYAVQFVVEAGLIRHGFSFQIGNGRTAFSIQQKMLTYMMENQIRARFVLAGANGLLTKALESGQIEKLFDLQTTDKVSLASLATNPNHKWVYVGDAEGNSDSVNGSDVDLAFLNATQIDLAFNVNWITKSDGTLANDLCFWQDSFGAKIVIMVVPLFRNRVPFITNKVVTLCAPGSVVDVVVTDRGIAINPKREDLIQRMKNSVLPIKSIEELYKEANAICGEPQKLEFEEQIIAAVHWVDGSLLDVVRQLRQ